MRKQKPIRGNPRVPLASCQMKQIRRIVEREAERYDVSKSFVVAVALAAFFGVKDQEQY